MAYTGCNLILSVKDSADHDKWLAVRDKGIGGSDAAVILGLNKYKSPYKLWLEKTGLAAPEDLSNNQYVYWGTKNEANIADWFQEEADTLIARIELGTLTPYPEEAVLMADAYNAPNLMNHFCTAECPIGKRIMMQADLEQLDKMAIDILAAVHGVANVSDAVLTIVADGRVSGEEMDELQKVMENMQQVAKAASELQIYISKAKGGVRKL